MAISGPAPGFSSDEPTWNFPPSLTEGGDKIALSPQSDLSHLSTHRPQPDRTSPRNKAASYKTEKHPLFLSISQLPPSTLIVAPLPAPQPAPGPGSTPAATHVSKARRKRRQYKKITLASDDDPPASASCKGHDGLVHTDIAIDPIVLPIARAQTIRSPGRRQPPSSGSPRSNVTQPNSYTKGLEQLADQPSHKHPRRRRPRKQNNMTVSIPPHLRYRNNPPPAPAAPTNATNGATKATNGALNGASIGAATIPNAANGAASTESAKSHTNGALKQSRHGSGEPSTFPTSLPPLEQSFVPATLPTPPITPAQPNIPPSLSAAHFLVPDKAVSVEKSSPPTSIKATPAPIQNGKRDTGFASRWETKVAPPLRPNPRSRRWPTSKEMRPPPSDKDNDGGVSIKSNSNGDPAYDVRKLTDWEGNWLPAPVEWEGRHGFSDRNFFERIDGWINKTNRCCRTTEVIEVASQDGDVAPKLWIPTTIDAESPQAFWRSYQSRAPAPMSDYDSNERPWWERYISPASNLLISVAVPDSILDRRDPSYGRSQQDHGSDGAVRKRHELLKIKASKSNAKNRKRAAASKAAFAAYASYPVLGENSLNPKANIFLRPAYPADMDQIKEIQNHYIEHTIHSPEFEPRTRQHIRDRITDITGAHLPFIVAIDRSKQVKNGGLKHLPERIVGFADVDDYCHAGSMYRFTVELEMFVHPDYLHQGIGSCLLDKMLSLLDHGYIARGGYDWFATGNFRQDGARIVKAINCVIPYNADNDHVIMWTKKWLNGFQFKARGDLYQMGFKNNTRVDVAIFQFITSEHIEAQQRPTNPL